MMFLSWGVNYSRKRVRNFSILHRFSNIYYRFFNFLWIFSRFFLKFSPIFLPISFLFFFCDSALAPYSTDEAKGKLLKKKTWTKFCIDFPIFNRFFFFLDFFVKSSPISKSFRFFIGFFNFSSRTVRFFFEWFTPREEEVCECYKLHCLWLDCLTSQLIRMTKNQKNEISSLVLNCVISETDRLPLFIFWTHAAIIYSILEISAAFL